MYLSQDLLMMARSPIIELSTVVLDEIEPWMSWLLTCGASASLDKLQAFITFDSPILFSTIVFIEAGMAYVDEKRYNSRF